MYWCSSAESEKFVKSVEDAYGKVIRAGLNPINMIDEKKKITIPVE